MAIKLVSNYAKRLGLPGYSSHQFSVSVETELSDLGQVQGEAARIYSLLQDAVDREIQNVGFVPGEIYGLENDSAPRPNGAPPKAGQNAPWNCSSKQKDLILKLVEEHQLDRHEVDQLAEERFGLKVRHLNKLQASGLIDELLEKYGQHSGNGNGGRVSQPNGQRRGNHR